MCLHDILTVLFYFQDPSHLFNSVKHVGLILPPWPKKMNTGLQNFINHENIITKCVMVLLCQRKGRMKKFL